MSHCPFCSKKIAMSKAFCSKACKENYFELISIQIPKPFLKKIFIFCDEYERDKEITKFAKRHGWRERLLRMKIKSLASEFQLDNKD